MRSKTISFEEFYEKGLTNIEKSKILGRGIGLGTPPPPPPNDLTSTSPYTPTFGDSLDTPP